MSLLHFKNQVKKNKMDLVKIKNKGQARLFSSDYLEILTKANPLVICSMYLPVIILMLYHGIANKGLSAWVSILLFILGAFFWSIFEYMMHRYLFHMMPESKHTSRLVYTMHGVHHEYPKSKERLFMPPVPSLLVTSVLFTIGYGIMGWNSLAFFPGFLFGYLVYGSIHYAIHACSPPEFMKGLWRNHHLHHYKTPEKGFGVSSVLWDVVFRTVPDYNECTNIKSSTDTNQIPIAPIAIKLNSI